MSPRALCRLLVALVLVAASLPASAQSLFDLLTGGGRPAAPHPAPEPSVAPRPTAPRPEAKKKKPAAPKPTDQAQKTPGATPEAAPSPDGPPAPYEPQALRLSEMIGALAYLRDLCGAGDGDDWRNKMTALLAAEAPTGARHDKYVAAFNHGFRGYELTYRTCTPNARAAITRYLDEAGRLTEDITYRYGGV